ncbi:UvrD-helicase domain-containing protein [Roseibium polysiphoniae]|nr:UvrD-helicase domain-containing protein [Roseibium polysiphoniae]
MNYSGRSSRAIEYAQVAGPPFLTKKLGFSVLVLPLADGSEIQLGGVKHEEADRMILAIRTAWREHFEELVSGTLDDLSVISDVVDRLKRPRRYPSACLLDPFVDRADYALKFLPDLIPDGALPPKQQELVGEILHFRKEPETLRRKAIDLFIEAELVEVAAFLDEIESNPLTPEQRLAVLADEDATLVLAGAGSGKTSVIVAKAAYLVRQGIRAPEDILLLAFGKAAAAEMTERIEERAGVSVTSLTFHALGYEIIREVEKGVPALAPHAIDEAQFRALLRDILINDVASRPDMALLMLKWFSELLQPYKNEWDFKNRSQYYDYVESCELRTLQGELVRSFEELEIANWLYLKGVAYEYEPDYEHPLPGNTRKAYTPDFRLTESGLYIEHFGVRKSKGPDGEIRLVTAPHVDREIYLEGMAWKRRVHQEHGTTLIETYSYERVENRLTEALEEKLAPHVTFNPVPPERILEKLVEMGEIDAFTQTLGTFLQHFKSSGSSLSVCQERAEKSEDKARSLSFLKIFEAVYEAYQLRLGSRIDFEDMIARATRYVASGQYRSRFRHLLVDEFQDISEGRAQLLLALKAQHRDVRIFAVGDDWQSIYRFAGSDLHLMRHFGEIFGGRFAGKDGVHQVVDLGRTFRSVDRIALPARDFVLKNPKQIKKKVVPAKFADGPCFSVVHYRRRQSDHALRSALDALSSRTNGNEATVLLLGRYNFQKPKSLNEISSGYANLSIRFMTVHGSKGLEADHVVILGAVAGRLGFPSEIVDDPLLDLVLPEPENFDHAEERRLFYVALTRAKKSVTILADRDEPSVFVKEVMETPAFGVVSEDREVTPQAKCSECGGRMVSGSVKSRRPFLVCEHRRLCGNTRPTCNACGQDVPMRSKTDPDTFRCSCGEEAPACPECKDGWLVRRSGRYGAFLGCVDFPKCDGKGKIKSEPHATDGTKPQPRSPR